MSINYDKKESNDWITQSEASRIRNVSRQAINNLIKLGRLSTYSLGGVIFVSRTEIENFEPNQAGRKRKNE